MGGLSDVVEAAERLAPGERIAAIRAILSTDAGTSPAVDAYPTGFVVYAEDEGPQACPSFLLLPGVALVGPGWLAVASVLGMVYVFLGIAIISDLFMGSIEVITSAERTVRSVAKNGEQIEVKYRVWNRSVANLTLMALGSSAPEILLAIIGTVRTLNQEPDELGPSTIVGSAAFNLLVITAICIVALPEEQVRRIAEVGVFAVTATFSLVAYIWLFLVLAVVSPNEVELWEAVVTFSLFPLLVFVAYGQDVRWSCTRKRKAHNNPGGKELVRLSPKKGDKRARLSTGDHEPHITSFKVVREAVTDLSDETEDAGADAGGAGVGASADPALASERRNLPEADDAVTRSQALELPPEAPLSGRGQQLIDQRVNELAQLRRMGGTKQARASIFEKSEPLPMSAKANYSRQAVRGLVGKKRLLPSTPRPGDEVENDDGNVAGNESPVDASDGGAGTAEGDLPVAASGVTRGAGGDNAPATDVGGTSQTRTRPKRNLPFPGAPGADGESHPQGLAPHATQTDQNQPGHAGQAGDADRRSLEGLSVKKGAAVYLDAERVVVEFTHRNYYVARTWDKAVVVVRRTGNVNHAVTLTWRTEWPGDDQPPLYVPTKGEVRIPANDSTALITVDLEPLSHDSASGGIFAVDILGVEDDDGGPAPELGKRQRTNVCVVEPDATLQPSRGQLIFNQPRVTCPEAAGVVSLGVWRVGGHDGLIEARYRTVDGTATGGSLSRPGSDFVALDDYIRFAPFETYRTIPVTIIDDTEREIDEQFTVELSSSDAGAIAPDGGVCEITIIDDDSWNEKLQRMLVGARLRLASSLYSTSTWAEQFRDALVLSGGVDEATGQEMEPTAFDSLMHSLSIFWKVLFALVPPSSYLGGWAAFVASLIFIGFCTFIVGEFASLFGCVVGLPDSVTAITFVALGTSLPDTLASRTAAIQDDTADAAVGNVTGSNSVNVFLGLGLPWLIGSLYHSYFPTGLGKYRVPAGQLAFSVGAFTICAVIALVILVLRRMYVGGELGGPQRIARVSAGLLLTEWMLYVVLASFQSTGQLPGFR